MSARAAAAPGMSPQHLARLARARRVQVIDLRPPVQWEQGHITGSRNITLDDLPAEAITLDRELPIAFYGNDGAAASEAASAIRAAGMTAFALHGGLEGWIAAGQPVSGAVAAAQSSTTDPVPSPGRSADARHPRLGSRRRARGRSAARE